MRDYNHQQLESRDSVLRGKLRRKTMTSTATTLPHNARHSEVPLSYPEREERYDHSSSGRNQGHDEDPKMGQAAIA
jgi:hypothetical protein